MLLVIIIKIRIQAAHLHAAALPALSQTVKNHKIKRAKAMHKSRLFMVKRIDGCISIFVVTTTAPRLNNYIEDF